jgi:hypothetical protein
MTTKQAKMQSKENETEKNFYHVIKRKTEKWRIFKPNEPVFLYFSSSELMKMNF